MSIFNTFFLFFHYRKYKDLATFALQYQKHNDGLIAEYYDGFRKTNAKWKVNLFIVIVVCA